LRDFETPSDKVKRLIEEAIETGTDDSTSAAGQSVVNNCKAITVASGDIFMINVFVKKIASEFRQSLGRAQNSCLEIQPSQPLPREILKREFASLFLA